MRKTIIRLVSMLGILFLLFAALIALIRFNPYPSNFPAYPKVTHTKSGATGDPINVLFVGSKNQIMHSFQQASWLIPDPITSQTSAKIAGDSLAHRSYPTAPVSNLYVFGRVQDLAFEKPTNDVQNRGHIRISKTDTLIDLQPVLLRPPPSHTRLELTISPHYIAPTVDLERNAVGADLAKTGLVREEANAAFTLPIFFARNGGGDYYESDGTILVINYTQAPIPLTQAAWGIDGLKTGMFLFYDALFTVVGALVAFLSLVAILLAGLVLLRFAERNRPLSQT